MDAGRLDGDGELGDLEGPPEDHRLAEDPHPGGGLPVVGDERAAAAAERLAERHRDEDPGVVREQLPGETPPAGAVPAEPVRVVDVEVEVRVPGEEVGQTGERGEVAEHGVDPVGEIPDLRVSGRRLGDRPLEGVEVVVREDRRPDPFGGEDPE